MRWLVPLLEEELSEFIRVSKELGINLTILFSLFDEGTVEVMDNQTWCSLENTDSGQALSVDDVIQISTSYERDARVLLSAFRAETDMYMPIVLFLETGKTHLVSGNTRLMICRALNITPRFFKLQEH